MKTFLNVTVTVGIVLGILALIALAGGLLVLLAYGVGLLVNLVLHFEPFQVTVLSLAGIVIMGWLAMRMLDSYMSPPSSSVEDEDYDEDWYYDEAEDDEDAAEDEKPEPYAGIPRWRQPLKQLDFSTTQPDDRCPCGSGRKYKNCHGTKRKT